MNSSAGPDQPAAPSDGGLIRLRLQLAYDGSGFAGWARQPGRRTVQGVVEDAIALVLRRPEVRLTVAGRTDTGVHARGQVAHVDLPAVDPAAVARRLARVLPPDVRVPAVSVAPPGFDARFGALWRRYAYRIDDGPHDPLRRHDTAWVPGRLDVAAMHDAAGRLTGLHDFGGFCRRRDTGTTIRTVLDFGVRRDVDAVVGIGIRADAFCHSMVRSLVGALIAVGSGRRPPDWPATLLDRTERATGFTVAPPHGLCLVEVGYPPDDQLAARAAVTRAVRAP